MPLRHPEPRRSSAAGGISPGIHPGDEVLLRLEDDELRISTMNRRISRAQRNARKYVRRGVSLVDELLAGRREAAASE